MVQKLIESGYALDSEKFRSILQSDETLGIGDQTHVEDVNVS